MAKTSGFNEGELVIFGGLAFIAWVVFKGGINGAAQAAGQAAVEAVKNAVQGGVTGAVNAVGSNVGLPTSNETTDDPYVSRWIMDAEGGGKFEASKWSTSSAFLNAMTIRTGDGIPPIEGTAMRQLFPRAGDVIDMGVGGKW